MTPRTDAPWVRDGMLPREFLTHIQRHSQGQYAVYKGSVDNVSGILFTRDVLRTIAAGQLGETTPMTSLAKPPFFVPGQKLRAELLDEIRKDGVQLAVMVDEFGDCAGTVTIIQVLESLVSPLNLADGDCAGDVKQLSDGAMEIAGDIAVEEVNARLNITLLTGDYVTVASLLPTQLGHIPREGEQAEVGNVVLQVARMRGRQIARVRIHRVPPKQEATTS